MSDSLPPPLSGTLKALFERHAAEAERRSRLEAILLIGSAWLLLTTVFVWADRRWEFSPSTLRILWLILWSLVFIAPIRAIHAGRKAARHTIARLESVRPELGQLFSTALWALEKQHPGPLEVELQTRALRELQQTPIHSSFPPNRGPNAPLLFQTAACLLILALPFNGSAIVTLRRLLLPGDSRYTRLHADKLPDLHDGKRRIPCQITLEGKQRPTLIVSLHSDSSLQKTLEISVVSGSAVFDLPAQNGDIELEIQSGDSLPLRKRIAQSIPTRLTKPFVRVLPPAYSGLPEKTVPNPTRLEVIEGSTLQLCATTDPTKAADSAQIHGSATGSLVQMGPGFWEGNPAQANLKSMTSVGNGEMRIQLEEPNARLSETLSVSVSVKPDELPAAEIQGEELGENIRLNASFDDDLGIAKGGIVAFVDGREVELAAQTFNGTAAQANLQREVSPAQLLLTPGTQVEVRSFAEDLAPAHAGKRSYSEPLVIVLPSDKPTPVPMFKNPPKKLVLKDKMHRLEQEARRLSDEQTQVAKNCLSPNGPDSQSLPKLQALQKQAATDHENLLKEIQSLQNGSAGLQELSEEAADAIAQSIKALASNDLQKASQSASTAADRLSEIADFLNAQALPPEKLAELSARQALKSAADLARKPDASSARKAASDAESMAASSSAPNASEIAKALRETNQSGTDDTPAQTARKQLASRLHREALDALAKTAERNLAQEAALLQSKQLAESLLGESQSPEKNPTSSPPRDAQAAETAQALAQALSRTSHPSLASQANGLSQQLTRGEMPEYERLKSIIREADSVLQRISAERLQRFQSKEAAGSGAELSRRYFQELSEDATPIPTPSQRR